MFFIRHHPRLENDTPHVRCGILPYLVTQVLHQAASDLREKYPLAADTIIWSFYVDDFLTGASTVDDARILREELCQLLHEVGLTLRKWRSNLKEKSPEVVIAADPTVYGKTLVIHWNTQTDSFHVAAPTMEDATPTKRTVASAVARLFNVMGWCGPVSLYIKIYLQRLW